MTSFVEAARRTAAERAAAAEEEWLAGPVHAMAVAELDRFLVGTFSAAAADLVVDLVSHERLLSSMDYRFERVWFRVSSGADPVLVTVDLWSPTRVHGVERPLSWWRSTFRSARWRLPLSPRRAARRLDGV